MISDHPTLGPRMRIFMPRLILIGKKLVSYDKLVLKEGVVFLKEKLSKEDQEELEKVKQENLRRIAAMAPDEAFLAGIQGQVLTSSEP